MSIGRSATRYDLPAHREHDQLLPEPAVDCRFIRSASSIPVSSSPLRLPSSPSNLRLRNAYQLKLGWVYYKRRAVCGVVGFSPRRWRHPKPNEVTVSKFHHCLTIIIPTV